MRYPLLLPLLLLSLAALRPDANAAVGLVTVPTRQSVHLTIYNGVDLTLVQESRTLVLRKGMNRIQYQWAGTLIDTTSLELRALDHQGDLELIDTISPPHAPATVIWEVESTVEGAVPFEISYFSSGISWSADYALRADHDETTATFDGWVGVTNRSGEDYAQAEVRLVVGSIALVETIRDLATGQIYDRKRQVERQEVTKHLRGVLRKDGDDKPSDGIGRFGANKQLEQIEVVSTRLADYHIFTISGMQSVPDRATTRFLAVQPRHPMAIEILYRVVLGQELGAQKLYRFVNDAQHQLPDGPLPDGPWHVFRVTDKATHELSHQGVAQQAYVPPGQKVELALGIDPGLSVTEVQAEHEETDHHYDLQGHVDGWIAHDRWNVVVVNTRLVPVSLECLVPASGDWTITGLSGERRDQTMWRHQDTIATGARLELGPFTISTRLGARASGGQAQRPVQVPASIALPPVRTAR